MFGETRLRCDKCKIPSVSHGIEKVPEYMRSYIRGDIVNVIKSIGVCGECYAVLCSECAPKGRCSVCSSPYPLLAECPSTPPPLWNIFRRLKWYRVFHSQF